MTDTNNNNSNNSNNNNNNNKLKILLFGPVGDHIDAFFQKLNRLHKSKAGPFDAAFCVGLFDAAALLDKITNDSDDDNKDFILPMKVFLQDPLQEIKQLVAKRQQQQKDEKDEKEAEEKDYPCFKLAHNLYILRNPQPPFSATVWSLPIVENKAQLVVAACPSRLRVNTKETSELEKAVSHVSYTGCDLLLSSEWPQGIESIVLPNVLPKSSAEQQQQPAAPTSSLPLSFDVAHVALQARARYHVTPSPNSSSLGFVQSPPFAHSRATTNTATATDDGTTLHVGRFLALGAMTSLEKKGAPKFVHALGLQPFHSLSYFELQQQRPDGNSLQACPFTDSTYQCDNDVGVKDKPKTASSAAAATTSATSAGLSEASARRILAEEQSKFGSGATALVAQRWQQKRKRPTPSDGVDDDGSVAVDPNNTTLFVHGLHHDVRGILQQQGSRQGDTELFQAFTEICGPGSVLTVRRPVAAGQTSSFCFVEMQTHDQATMIWQLRELDVHGVPLSIKWATAANMNKGGGGGAGAGGSRKDHHHGQADGQPPRNKRTRLTEAEARDSTTVYFQLRTAVPQLSTSSLGPTTAAAVLTGTLSPQQEQELKQQQGRFKAIAERLRRWMEETLETALADDDSDVKVTAAEEPALQVQLRLVESTTQEEGGAEQQQHHQRPRNYGFLEFASHAAASMALATLTGNTDGGVVLNDAPGMPTTFTSDSSGKGDAVDDKDKANTDSIISGKDCAGDDDKSKDNPEEMTDSKNSDANKAKDSSDDNRSVFLGLRLHWGHAKKDEEKKKRTMIEDAESGFRFERKHFPADSRTDCWFCLASESCEKHLITSVHDTCYSALPRGGMHPGHVLLIPVQHSSQGVLKMPRVAQEMEDLKKALRKHAAQVYDQSDLFVFERAIQTRGGYHAHVQCVPIPSGLGIQLQATMMAQARKIGLPLRELTSDLAVSAVLNNNDDDDEDGNNKNKNSNSGGYFYAEIPTRGGKQDYKKFLYQANSSMDSSSSSRATVPLQFGREVLAAVLRKPELAHWKSCLVDPEKEAAMATDFRKSFAEIK